MPRLLLCAALLIGCSDDEQIAADLSESFCNTYKECRTDGFNKNWQGVEGCVSQQTDRWTGKLNSLEDGTQLDCKMDNRQVRKCKAALEEIECGDFSGKSWEKECVGVLVCLQGLQGDW